MTRRQRSIHLLLSLKLMVMVFALLTLAWLMVEAPA